MLLEIKGLHSFYGTSHILHGITLEIETDGIISVLGRNGVGKSTLIRSITGVVMPKEGSIVFKGTDITKMKSHDRARLGISLVPQGRELIPDVTVEENLMVALIGRGRKNGAIPDYIFDYFPSIKEFLKRKAGVLSGGQQQLVAIARALIQEPQLLLLDEPTEGLQPSIVAEIQKIVRQIYNEHNCAILLVEQNLNFVRDVTHRFAMMEGGRILADGEIGELTEEIVQAHLSV